jgi:hypothetical protein
MVFCGAGWQPADRLAIGPSGRSPDVQRENLPAKPPLSRVTFHTRRLPHYDRIGHPTFLTWRLAGTLPKGRDFSAETTSGEAFLARDRLLDNARTGPLYLRQPEIARLVVDAIRHRDGGVYKLHHYVVMANHVHLLITPQTPLPN